MVQPAFSFSNVSRHVSFFFLAIDMGADHICMASRVQDGWVFALRTGIQTIRRARERRSIFTQCETPLLLTPFAHWTPHSRPPPNPICGTKRSEKFCHSIYKSPSVSLLRHSGFCIAGTKMGYGRFTLVLYSKLHIQRSRMVRAFCPRQAGFPWFSSLSRHCSYGLASVLYRGLWYIGQDCMLLIGGFLHCGRRCR